MGEVIYSEHLKLRLKVRKIPYDYPQKVYEYPEQKYYDTVEKTIIAIKKLPYNQKVRNMMIAYEVTEEHLEIITIHPISDEKIINRLMNQRWIKHE